MYNKTFGLCAIKDSIQVPFETMEECEEDCLFENGYKLRQFPFKIIILVNLICHYFRHNKRPMLF